MEDSPSYTPASGAPARIPGSEARELFISAFAGAWQDACATGPNADAPSVLARYRRGGKRWTYCMLGDSEDWPRTPVVRDAITRYARARHYDPREDSLRIRRESAIGSFDVSFAGGAEGCPTSRNPYHFARRFELVLEHENEPARIHEEFWKLLKIRSDLAVLIGYQPSDLKVGPDVRMLSTIGDQMRAAVNEDPSIDAERFLVILGESMVPEQKPWLSWRAYMFDRSGESSHAAGKVL